jgi:hypothetical protein
MNIKALITMLVLGSSSVAMARPVTVSGHAGASIVAHQPEYRSPPPFVPQWVTLGTESRIIDGAMSFRVSPRLRRDRFSMLSLERTSGKSLIYQIKIQFTNGRTQVVELNKYLNASNPILSIDLAGDRSRSIRNVTVVGRNARQSGFKVLAI